MVELGLTIMQNGCPAFKAHSRIMYGPSHKKCAQLFAVVILTIYTKLLGAKFTSPIISIASVIIHWWWWWWCAM